MLIYYIYIYVDMYVYIYMLVYYIYIYILTYVVCKTMAQVKSQWNCIPWMHHFSASYQRCSGCNRDMGE